MGYGLQFSANQLGGWLKLWGIRSYGLSGVWVKRISTVLHLNLTIKKKKEKPDLELRREAG
jgi:hypothetical protein